MKKFLATLAIAALATCAQAVTYSWSSGDKVNQADQIKGFVFNLGSAGLTPSADAPTTGMVNITTMTVKWSTTTSVTTTPIYAYICSGDKVVGVSDMQAPTVGASSTFTYEGLTLDTDTTYKVWFSANEIAVGSNVTTSDLVQVGLSLSSTTGTDSTFNVNGHASWQPVVSFEGSTVPEPTAMALLLMGVAAIGLRRKARAA